MREPAASHVLAVDVGGTKTLIGAVNSTGVISGEWTQPTRVGGDDIDRVATFIAGVAAQTRPAAIGGGFPEYVDAGGALTSHEVLTWEHQPSAAISEALADCGLGSLPLAIESDVRLGALGEACYGAGRGASSFLYVSLGTGLSSTLVIDGVPWPGARGEAIALGEFDAPEGNLESYASGSGITMRYAALSGIQASGEEIVRAARSGDDCAAGVLRTAGKALGDAIAFAVGLIDPQLVVLGGGLGTADTPVTQQALQRYCQRMERRGAARWVSAACGHRSGLLGGAAAAWRALGP
ncbi:MAG: ROK family protein [Beutenbergiaceae bacterium]